MPVERGKIGARGPVASRLLFGTLTMGPGQRDLPPERGGELIAGAAVQVAFNFGNAIGSIVGGAMLTTFSMNYRYTGLGGMPLALLAVGLLAFYSWRCETDTDAIHRLRETKVD